MGEDKLAQTTPMEDTLPKPFVFVLMPFDPDFNDIYKFGIKGAAKEVGAYAEHLGEQLFDEGMLDRIFSQISKADVVVADMSGRNPNVFYEVGYAHALNKVTILLTKNSDDIPFDLRHRRHIVYGGSIDRLKSELEKSLTWAISESKRRQSEAISQRFIVSLNGANILQSGATPSEKIFITNPYQQVPNGWLYTRVTVMNDSLGSSAPISHIYLLTPPDPFLTPVRPNVFNDIVESVDPITPIILPPNRQIDEFVNLYRLTESIPGMPPGAVEEFSFWLQMPSNPNEEEVITQRLRLRFYSGSGSHDFDWTFLVRVAARPKR